MMSNKILLNLIYSQLHLIGETNVSQLSGDTNQYKSKKNRIKRNEVSEVLLDG